MYFTLKYGSFHSLCAGYLNLCDEHLGCFIVGDMNVHHIRWLKHSRENSPEGIALQEFSSKFGFKQCVREPTRGIYLLDLI